MIHIYLFFAWLDMEVLHCNIRPLCWFSQQLYLWNYKAIDKYFSDKWDVEKLDIRN